MRAGLPLKPSRSAMNETVAVIAFVVFCLFMIANWMNRPGKK